MKNQGNGAQMSNQWSYNTVYTYRIVVEEVHCIGSWYELQW